MKYKKIVVLLAIAVLTACGSSKKVITESGEVYEIKGDKFFNKGTNVTELLADEQKEALKTILQARLEAEQLTDEKKKALETENERLEKAQEKMENAIKEAEKKQDKLEEKQKEIEAKQDKKEDAREAFFKAKKRFDKKQEKFKKLKAKGKLSPLDEEKWKKNLLELEQEFKSANQLYINLK